MAKQSEPAVRRVKETLAIPAAKRKNVTPAVAAPSPPSDAPGSQLVSGADKADAAGNIGTPGTLNTWGFITGEDYNRDLDGFPMFPFYDKMRRSDAQVWASLLQVKLPFKAARKVIKPASDDPEDIAIAQFVTECLLGDRAMKRPFEQVLDHLMLRFDFGCSAEEIVWEIGDAGELRFKDLAPRLPRTFYRWMEWESGPNIGDLKSLEQYAPKNGRYESFTIPADRLVLHAHRREGNNYYGISLLRAAYPNWFWKQQLYRIDAIRHDRFGAGIFIAKLNENYSAKTAPLDKLEETLKGLRSHEQGYAVQPYGVEYDILMGKGGSDAATGLIQSIEHHNQMIAANVLQQFSTQGQQKHGSLGAAKVTRDAFYDALVGQGIEMAAELGDGAIRPLCDANFDMTGRAYPKFAFEDIATADVSAISTNIAALTTAGNITADDDLENWLRDLYGAPALPDALKGRDRSKIAVPSPPGRAPVLPVAPVPAVPGGHPTAVSAAAREAFHELGRTFGRTPTDLERRVFDLHGVSSHLDEQTTLLLRSLTAIRLAQLKTVAARVAQKDARATAAFTDIRHAHVKMPKVPDLARAIREAQTRTLAYGRESVHDELVKQGMPSTRTLATDPTAAANAKTAQSALVSSAQITARKQSETWLARILDFGLRLRRSGTQGADLERAIIEQLTPETETGAKRDAAAEIHEAFAIGRAVEATAQIDQIGKVIYSSLLDANTCQPCEDLDGEEMEYGSARYYETMPPYQKCEGNKGAPDACRCVHLFMFDDSEVRT